MWALLALCVVTLLRGGTMFPPPQGVEKSPKEVVEQYVRMGNEGLLLTSEGWRKAQDLFVEPQPFPRDKVIYLVSKGSSVGQLWVKGNRAEVEQMWREPLGTIDSALRYLPPKSNGAGTIFLYRLILTDKSRELGPDEKSSKKVIGPPRWRMEGHYSMPWATVEVAIRYVAKVRDETPDPAIKRNADETLNKLRQLARIEK